MYKIFLDSELIKEKSLSFEQIIVLIKIKNNINLYEEEKLLLKDLESNLFIKIITNQKNVLRQKGLLLLDEMSSLKLDKTNDKKVTITYDKEFIEFIIEFRNKFKGLKPGSMGSMGACMAKMKRWIESNPNYSKEEILKATDNYLSSLTSYNYLQQADYFIYKKESNKEESSRLSAFIDELEITPEENWTINLK